MKVNILRITTKRMMVNVLEVKKGEKEEWWSWGLIYSPVKRLSMSDGSKWASMIAILEDRGEEREREECKHSLYNDHE